MHVYGGCGYSGWMLVVVGFEIGCVEECASAEGGASARKTASARVGVPMTVSLDFCFCRPPRPTHSPLHSTPHSCHPRHPTQHSPRPRTTCMTACLYVWHDGLFVFRLAVCLRWWHSAKHARGSLHFARSCRSHFRPFLRRRPCAT